VFFDESKSHCFRPAKNWVVFLGCPAPPEDAVLTSKPVISLARPKSSLRYNVGVSVCRDPLVQRRHSDTKIIGHLLTRVSPLVSAIRTASLRNSSVRQSHSSSPCCNAIKGAVIKPRQVHGCPRSCRVYVVFVRHLRGRTSSFCEKSTGVEGQFCNVLAAAC
jgi:hypothetical protein